MFLRCVSELVIESREVGSFLVLCKPLPTHLVFFLFCL